MLRFVLIGCGRISKRHADLLGNRQIKGAELAAVCDVVSEKAARLASAFGVPHYTDMHEMCSREVYDVIVVLTESGLHAKHVLELARYRKHIVVEKPMALTLDDANPANSSVEATIDVTSIETRDAQRDAHLKSAEFFDAEKFPTMTFRSTRVTPAGIGEGTVEGDLTIRDVTKSVTFNVEGPTPPAKDPWGNARVGVSATTKISRKEFGLTWSAPVETGGVLIGDEVTITLDVEFVKA